MNIAILAAGAGGMYCGSCMRDSTLASALIRAGHSATLVPLYTPLKTDSPNQSVNEVFYGGVNVYLQFASRIFRHTPRFLDWIFDRKWLLRWAGSAGAQTSPAKLGPFTLSILRGEHGMQIKELRRLIGYLKEYVKPTVVSLPNAMFIGMAKMIREELGAAVVCELTGEDIFLDAMIEPYLSQARDIIRERSADVDAFVSTSNYYADRMADYLAIPRQRIAVVYPGVDKEVRVAPSQRPPNLNGHAPVIAYLARICPEKGLDRLIDAFEILRRLPQMSDARLRIAGYLGGANHKWFEQLQKSAQSRGLSGNVEYLGEVDLAGKINLFDNADVLCVPTAYAEPKGIYILEALARGLPVVQPAHGAFPELIAETNGGLLAPNNNPDALAHALADLLGNAEQRRHHSAAGRAAVHDRFTDDHMAANMLKVYESSVAPARFAAQSVR